jgi:hypothetical protein
MLDALSGVGTAAGREGSATPRASAATSPTAAASGATESKGSGEDGEEDAALVPDLMLDRIFDGVVRPLKVCVGVWAG